MEHTIADEWKLLAWREKSKGHFVRVNGGVALRAVGQRANIHPNDVYATAWDDEDLAEESCRINMETYGHDTLGPVRFDHLGQDRYLIIVDIRQAIRDHGKQPTPPGMPDGWRQAGPPVV